jgi:hypothetical protein
MWNLSRGAEVNHKAVKFVVLAEIQIGRTPDYEAGLLNLHKVIYRFRASFLTLYKEQMLKVYQISDRRYQLSLEWRKLNGLMF